MAPPIKMDPRLTSLPGIRSALESVRTPFNPKSIEPYRKGLASLPGMDTKIYDDMVEQADDSAKLNFAMALMQAGFGAAGASAQPGESPVSTLSRTLLAPLAGAAGKVASDSKKQKMAARLGKLQAQGRISSTAYQAALADKTAIDTEISKIAAGLLKPKTGLKDTNRKDRPMQMRVGGKWIDVLTNVRIPSAPGGTPNFTLTADVTKTLGDPYKAGSTVVLGDGEGQLRVKPDKASAGGKPSISQSQFARLLNSDNEPDGPVIPIRRVSDGTSTRVEASDSGKQLFFSGEQRNAVVVAAPAARKALKPDKPEGLDSKLFKDFWKSATPQIGSLENKVDLVDKRLTWKNGKFAFFDEGGETKIFDDAAQKTFTEALKLRTYSALQKFGGAEKLGDAESANFLEGVVSEFFKTDPKLLLDTLMEDRENFLPDAMRKIPTAKQLDKTVARKLTDAKNNNNMPVVDLLDGLRSNSSNATKPAGRLLDMVGTNPLLFGSVTTGDVFNPQTNSASDISKRMLTENVMKSLPANLTSPTKKILRSAANRASVIQTAVNKKIEERNKKYNSSASQELRDTLLDSFRGVNVIDRYSKVAVQSGAEGWITGSIKKALETRGLQVLNPATWGETKEQKDARSEAFVLEQIMQQLNARTTLKQTGELRYSKADLDGAQAVWNKIKNSPSYNAAALKEMRGLLISNIKKQLGQTGSFAIDDKMMEQAIELGIKPEDIKVAKSDKGFYNKYLPKPERKYNLTGQYAPGVRPERYKELEQLGVFKPFKTDTGRYMLYETEVIPPTKPGNPPVVQPVLVNGKMKKIFVKEENLMSDNQQMRNDRAFSFDFFKNSLRR